MLDFFYFVFIFPLEQLLSFALSGIFAATKNGALSVVLLSLFINLFLLKLLKCSDKKAAIQSARQAKFDERINRWKTVYSKAKVFAFTQTLYRQNHYHPIFALSSLSGLAIQVPFFLGVYFVIQNGNTLPNADFASISAIDSALKIHVLPILMTAITLLNVFLSSKETTARLQGSIIAFLFLILLYEMPHALVLYWTTNMAFSLCRTLLKTKIKINKSDLPKVEKPPKNFHRFFKTARFTICALGILGVVLFFWAITQHYNNPQILKNVGLCALILSGIVFLYFLILTGYKVSQNNKNFNNIILWNILNITFLICIFTPFNLYQSDIRQFHPSFTLPTLFALFGTFLTISFLLIYLISFIKNKKTQWILSFILSVLLIIGILNSFILTGDYGNMDRFVFQLPIYSTPESRFWQDGACALTIIFSAVFSYYCFFYLKCIFQIMFITISVVSLFNAFHIISARIAAEKEFSTNYAEQNIFSPYEKELFSYSKNDKNIVVMILDAFTGSHMPYLLEYFPKLKTQLDGFTLFDNAISSSTGTRYVVPSIISGEYYTIHQQNLRRANHDQAALDAFYNVSDAFAKENYNVGLIIGVEINQKQKLMQNPEIFLLEDTRVLRDYFLKEKAQTTFKNSYIFDIARFLSFSLFKFAPDGNIRYGIYNNGQWFFKKHEIDENKVIDNIAPFYAFTKIGNNQSTKPTFKYIHSLITHSPFGISAEGGQCNFLKTGTVWKKPELFEPPENIGNGAGDFFLDLFSDHFKTQHFDSEACALFLLNDYLEHLKKLGVYDNTQILIVSDHAGTDSVKTMPRMKPLFFGQDIVFLFKDFNARGELKTDSRLMANFDIATIFCENLKNACPNVAPNILKNYPNNREIITLRPNTTLIGHDDDWWQADGAYKIRGNLYNPAAYIELPISFYSKK